MTTLAAPRKLRTAQQIVDALFPGTGITARWVRTHCPRVQLSAAKVMFDETAVLAWIASRQLAAPVADPSP